MLMSSESYAQFLLPLISSLCFAQSQLPHASHLFSQLCPLHATTSLSLRVSLSFLLSSVENLLPLLLLSSSSSTGIPLFFFKKKNYLSNLIWEIHFEGRVLINKTPSNTDLLPKTTRYQHWSEIFFFFLTIKKKISDLACFVLAKDLFVLLPGIEKSLWVHAL